MTRAQIPVLLAFVGLAVTVVLMIGRIAASPRPEVELASFATSLRGRTENQRHNAMLSANDLHNEVIPPGGVFSFNKAVKTWSADEGYVKAPVSYDGEMIPAYGGGVCQTSTTLYNAVLLAGMPIVERHRHVFAAHYAQPGRDAAVAQENINLRFRNPNPWPIRIEASARSDKLIVRLIGAEKSKQTVEIITQVIDRQNPERLTRRVRLDAYGRRFARNPGATGYRVITDRAFFENGREIRRERLSDDNYQPMDRIVRIAESTP